MWIAVDENEDKIVFLCSIKTAKDDFRPKVTAYVTSLSKTFQIMLSGEILKF